ncbi:MAG: translation initiation factor IF-3 [Firmicutes bacterium]|nr:translation initiation factor IF-3 [Bacillota bacterium]
MRVIDVEGEQLGIMSSLEAYRLAQDKGLDLVKINPGAKPPVCKIMDYGKYKFDMSKKEKQVKKAQKQAELKEIRLSMTIDVGDVQTKAKHAIKFLSAGDKVKVSIRMKGRQQAHSKLGIGVMNDFYKLIEEVGVMEKIPSTEGRNIIMIVMPKK